MTNSDLCSLGHPRQFFAQSRSLSVSPLLISLRRSIVKKVHTPIIEIGVPETVSPSGERHLVLFLLAMSGSEFR
jgi:hypothetical protein